MQEEEGASRSHADFPIQGTIVATSLASGEAMAFTFGLTLPAMEVRAQLAVAQHRSALDRLPGAMGSMNFGSLESRAPPLHSARAGARQQLCRLSVLDHVDDGSQCCR